MKLPLIPHSYRRTSTQE